MKENIVETILINIYRENTNNKEIQSKVLFYFFSRYNHLLNKHSFNKESKDLVLINTIIDSFRKYNPTKGSTFSTYLTNNLYFCYLDTLEGQKKERKYLEEKKVDKDDLIDDIRVDELDPISQILAKDIKDILDTLEDKYIFEEHIYNNRTIFDIGRELKIPSRIIEQKIKDMIIEIKLELDL